MISREFVTECYRMILGREPESEAAVTNKIRGLKRFRSPMSVIREFMNSAEFQQQRRASEHGLTDQALRFVSPEIQERSGQLRVARPVDRETFHTACDAALPQMRSLPFGDQVDYLEYHKERFYELDNLIVGFAGASRAPRILDVGMSINSVIVRNLLPAAQISVCDRANIVIPDDSAFTLYNIDLTDPDLDTVALPGLFDVIVFAEVLEHLLANPVRVLRFLIRHLDARGRLIVTTPNFFSGGNVQAIRKGVNPQPIYPARLKRGEECEFHVREYSMSELLLLSEEAGGLPCAFFYSSCWDKEPDALLPKHWSNLCAIIERAAAIDETRRHGF